MSESKTITNTLYHAAVVSSIAAGSTKLTKMVLKTSTPRLDFNMYDIGMIILHIGGAMMIKDYLIKNKLIPQDIIN